MGAPEAIEGLREKKGGEGEGGGGGEEEIRIRRSDRKADWSCC